MCWLAVTGPRRDLGESCTSWEIEPESSPHALSLCIRACVHVMYNVFKRPGEDTGCPILLVSLPYSLETVSLIEPGARLAASGKQHCHDRYFTWVLGIQTRVLKLSKQGLLLLKHVLSPHYRFY